MPSWLTLILQVIQEILNFLFPATDKEKALKDLLSHIQLLNKKP